MAFYQLIFTNTAATIVSGAVAERLNLPCYFIYGILLSGKLLNDLLNESTISKIEYFSRLIIFVVVYREIQNKKGFSYPLLSRWGWYDGGWLKEMGFRDFGGSGLVHMFSGACAFIAANIIGPRAGRFDPPRQGEPAHGQHIPGHSLPVPPINLLRIFNELF